MPARNPLPRIGIYGPDSSSPRERHGCNLWPAGIAASLTAAEADPIAIADANGRAWDDLLEGLQGMVIVGHDNAKGQKPAEFDTLCHWCKEHKLPLLGIDHGMHALNTAFGGTMYFDLPRDLPEALQHRHPPERGLRHAINVIPDTQLAKLYGEGEVVVNSEHRRAVQRVARGFRVGANALDGVVESVEAVEFFGWFAMGVQWQPASATASGLDIQLFRGLIDACANRGDFAEQLECAAA
jgi:gamma-glutamyl-gamma-aminobutyrate hydrolase PuuD